MKMKRYENRLKNLFFLFCISGMVAGADEILLKSGERLSPVTLLAFSGDVLSYRQKLEEKTVSVTEAVQVNFATAELAAKQVSILLTDGSMLSGVPRERKQGVFFFRSTTFGPLEIKQSDCSGFVYEPEILNRVRSDELKYPCAVYRNGNILEGKILWADEKTAGVSTKNGLKKIPVSELGAVFTGAFESKRRTILRNGDILNGTLLFQGKKLSMKHPVLGEREIPLQALKIFYFQ